MVGAMDLAPLDNPIWNALNGGHRAMARANGLARRYPGDVSPLTGLADASERAFADLESLLSPGEFAALFLRRPAPIPRPWKVDREMPLGQMVCVRQPAPATIGIVRLGDADVPEMLALTEATKPGPFLSRTHTMGEYYGIRGADGRLMAMAGMRLNLDAFVEVSAVCTDPEHRGKGLARELVSHVCGRIFAVGKTPVLHFRPDNESARRSYLKVGFAERDPLWLAVVTRA